MTSRALLVAVLRRWYVLVAGAVLSTAVLMVVLEQADLYYTRFDVVLLAPRNAVHPNNIEDPNYAIAPMAGLLVADVTGNDRPLVMASTDTTLYGEGVRHGSRLRLPNTGSQWTPKFDRPRIDVEVVDDDPQAVQAEAARIRTALAEALDRRQDDLGVAPQMRMTLLASAPDPIISAIGGSRPRAAAGVALLGASLATIGVYWLDRWIVGRREGRSAP